MRQPLLHSIHLAVTLAGLAFLAGCAPPAYSLAPDPTPYLRTSPTDYYLYLPSRYVPDRDWPLFVGIHSYSGDGTDCLRMWQDIAEREGFILVCPSLGEEGGGWYVEQGEASLRGILREVHKQVRAQSRFFLTGFSAGAEFAQAWAFDNPHSITGVAVLSAGNYYEPNPAARPVPFLIVIGDRDDPLSLENAKLFEESLKQANFTVELNILPGVRHIVTPQALEMARIFYRKVYAAAP